MNSGCGGLGFRDQGVAGFRATPQLSNCESILPTKPGRNSKPQVPIMGLAL